MGAASFALLWFDLGETAPGKGRTMRAQVAGYKIVLRSRAFWYHTMVISFSISAFFVFLAGAPLVASETFGLPPTAVGIAIGSTAFGYFIGSFIAGQLSERVTLGAMMIWGRTLALIGPTGGLVLVLMDVANPWNIFGLMITLGIGNGIALPSANTGAMSVRPDLAGSAAGLSGAIATAMGAVGSAVTGALLTPANSAWLFCLLLSLTCLCALAFAILSARAPLEA